MKFTRNWLFDHLETDRPLAEILDVLPMLGLEVESMVDRAATLAPFIIAEVFPQKQHPNADKLRVCMVNTGSGDPIQVICGAPNARSGMKGVFAPVGAYVPGIDLTLKAAQIRLSCQMACCVPSAKWKSRMIMTVLLILMMMPLLERHLRHMLALTILLSKLPSLQTGRIVWGSRRGA